MKKLIIFLVLIIAFAVFYYHQQYSAFVIKHACIEISMSGDFSENTEQECLKIKMHKTGTVKKDIDGITYKVVYVEPEQKNDEHLEKTSDDLADDSSSINDEEALKPDVKYEFSDITVVVVTGTASNDYTKDEIIDTVLAVQARYPDINILITDGFKVPNDRIIKNSVLFLNPMNDKILTLLKFGIILDESGKPFLINTSEAEVFNTYIGKK